MKINIVKHAKASGGILSECSIRVASSPGHSQILSLSCGEIGRRPGTNTTSRTGNSGLDFYVMWSQFHNGGNVPMQYAASTEQ